MAGVKKTLKMKLLLCVLLPAAFGLFPAGCMPIMGGERYYAALEKSTKSYKLYNEIESVLIMSATFKDRAFLEAYMDEYGRRYAIDDATRQAMLARELGEADEYNEFFVSAYTPIDEWNDFDGKNSIWRLYLLDSSGGRTSPISVKRVERRDPFYREFFPYLDQWSVGYVVRFPRYTEDGTGPFPAVAGERFSLVATGVKGTVELKWGGKPQRASVAAERGKEKL